MEFEGKIIAILNKREGIAKSTGNPWCVQEFVIENHDQYPKKMCFEVFGEDKLSQRVLLLTKHTICKPLSILFNKSLSECKFPDKWKSAIIMSLYKKGEINLSSNYRPIALLSCIGKLIERVVHKHIYNFK